MKLFVVALLVLMAHVSGLPQRRFLLDGKLMSIIQAIGTFFKHTTEKEWITGNVTNTESNF